MTITGDLGAAGNQNLAHIHTPGHTFKQKHTSRQYRSTTISIRTQMSPREDGTKVMCVYGGEWCEYIYTGDETYARTYTYNTIFVDRLGGEGAGGGRKGGRIRATQRNN